MKFLITLLFAATFSATLVALPKAPKDKNHPGSESYAYDFQRKTMNLSGRTVDVFMPTNSKGLVNNVPVIVFGHGQALNVSHYQKTFEHLARKGVAVIHPMYDNGFFDQNWRRMADDYNRLTEDTLKKYPQINPSWVVFSGHSKGAYIALLAAARKSLPGSLVLFTPAEIDRKLINDLPENLPMTMFWGESDTVIKKSLIKEIYNKAPLKFKQWVEVRDYSTLKADHFFTLTKGSFAGGKTGVSPFHFYGSWKWLLGAVSDLRKGSPIKNKFIYGAQTGFTGDKGRAHKITRSW